MANTPIYEIKFIDRTRGETAWVNMHCIPRKGELLSVFLVDRIRTFSVMTVRHENIGKHEDCSHSTVVEALEVEEYSNEN